MKVKDGKALVRVNSHRARKKMQQAIGRLPQGYYSFHAEGEWREVTPEELQTLKDAKIKGITSEVAGHAQILVVPDLEAGNMLAKNLTFLSNADAAGIVLGARVPIILTSRADSVRTRMASCAVAVLYADARRHIAAAALPAA